MIICEPEPYSQVTLTIAREGPGVFTVYEYHRHGRAVSLCKCSDAYNLLDWDEAVQLLEVLAEARRPGMTPAGWEQLELDV